MLPHYCHDTIHWPKAMESNQLLIWVMQNWFQSSRYLLPLYILTQSGLVVGVLLIVAFAQTTNGNSVEFVRHMFVLWISYAALFQLFTK